MYVQARLVVPEPLVKYFMVVFIDTLKKKHGLDTWNVRFTLLQHILPGTCMDKKKLPRTATKWFILQKFQT